MKVLVTGAAGFLGTPTARLLRAQGHEVVATDLGGDVALRGDLAGPEFCAALPDVDAVVHCAAVQYVTRDIPTLGRGAWFHRNNVVATANLGARYAGRGVHFVTVGSSMMYRQSGADAYTVRSPMSGQGVYSESKLAALRGLESRGLQLACVLPCIIAGRGREGLFRAFVRTMTTRGVVVVPGRGRHPVHMVHVSDVAALLATVVARRATGLYNAAGPGPLSILEWVTEIEDELRLDRVRRLHLPLAPLEMASRLLGYVPLAREQLLMLRHPHVLDTAESRALGWTPAWTNARIVRETARALAGG